MLAASSSLHDPLRTVEQSFLRKIPLAISLMRGEEARERGSSRVLVLMQREMIAAGRTIRLPALLHAQPLTRLIRRELDFGLADVA
jgi:hypothetical protein